jgi:hypothetical protein
VISHLSFSTKGGLRSTGAGQLPPRIVEPEVEEDDGTAEREAEKRADKRRKRHVTQGETRNKNSVQEWPNASVRLVVAATACASFAAAPCGLLSPPASRVVVGSYFFFCGLRSFPPGDTAVPMILLILILRLLASENKRRPIRLVTGPRSPRRRRAHLVVVAVEMWERGRQ